MRRGGEKFTERLHFAERFLPRLEAIAPFGRGHKMYQHAFIEDEMGCFFCYCSANNLTKLAFRAGEIDKEWLDGLNTGVLSDQVVGFSTQVQYARALVFTNDLLRQLNMVRL